MTFDGWPAATASGANVLFTLIAASAGAASASAAAQAQARRASGRRRLRDGRRVEAADGETGRCMATQSAGGESLAGSSLPVSADQASTVPAARGCRTRTVPDVSFRPPLTSNNAPGPGAGAPTRGAGAASRLSRPLKSCRC